MKSTMNSSMKKSTNFFTLVMTLLLSFSFAQTSIAQTQSRKNCADPTSSLLWEIKGKNSTVHLFGSIHVGTASFYPLAPEVESRFRNADYIVVEIDPSSMNDPALALEIQTSGMLPPGEKLDSQLSQPVIDELKKVLAGYGLPAENFMGFRPWFLTLFLSNMQIASMGYMPQYGVEQYILRSKPADAPILELESIRKQLDAIAELDGEAFLSYTLNTIEESKTQMKMLIDDWTCADKPAMTALFEEEFDVEGVPSDQLERLYEKLFLERNRDMATAISGYLKEGQGDYFVLVGTAHYLGADSVVDLLQKQGFEVNPLTVK